MGGRMRYTPVRLRARATIQAGARAGGVGVVTPLLVALLALVDTGCRRTRATPPPAPVVALDTNYEALRTDFMRDTGRPRLLVVVSPT